MTTDGPSAPCSPPAGAPAPSAAFVVRPATDAELDAAGDAAFAAYDADQLGLARYRAGLRDARDRAADAEIGVAVDVQGRVLGSVTFATPGSRWAELSRPGEAEFRMLGVHPAARGRGVGAALVEWCLVRAVELGLHRVVICSATSMSAAHRLYARRGFVRRPDLDWSPVPGVDLLGFSLDLQPHGGRVRPRATGPGTGRGRPRPG
jgi:GNAT superfamily N-acetyltransferase